MELWDVYNADRTKAKRTAVRGETLGAGSFHLVVHACIFNSSGQMLIQQRQPFKSGWPGMWDVTVGGSAIKGETSQEAMERELSEEIGLEISLKNVRPNFTVNFSDGFDDVYLILKDVDISKLKLQYEEVQNVMWASFDEISEKIDEGTFIPYFKSLISVFFDTRGQYGCHRIKEQK